MENIRFKKNIRQYLLAASLCAPLFWCGTASAIEASQVQLDKLSFEQIQQAAQAGDPDAQYALGYMYYYGKNTTQNTQEALNWIKRASVQGQEQAVKALVLIEGKASPTSAAPATTATAAANTVAPATTVQAQAPAQALNTSTPPHTPAQPAPLNTAAKVNAAPMATPSQPATQVASNNTAAQSQDKADHPAAAQNQNNTASVASSSLTTPTPVVASADKPASTASKSAPAPAVKQAANIKPAASSGSATLATQEKHLLGLPSDYHTVQLIGSYSEKDVAKYISMNGLQGKATYYRGNNNGKEWFVVLYGIYKTRPEAQAAIATLPESLKKQNPWVRSLSAVQASIKSAPDA